MPLKIIICGGGIGGLSAAGYLRANHDVTVLERSKLDFTINDYGLSVVANAFNLLQKAGIKQENLDMVVMTHLWLRTHNNEEMRTEHFDTRARFGGAPSVLLKRAKLQEELMRFATSNEFAGGPAKVIENAKVTRVDAGAGKVWSEDGQVFEGDLIIGADGIHSIVRSAVLGGETPSRIRNTDTITFMAKLSVEDLRSDASFAYLADPAKQAGLCSAYAKSGPEVKKRILTYHTSLHGLQVVGYTVENEFAEKFASAKSAIIKDIPISRVVEDFAPEFSDDLVNLFRHSKVDAWKIRDLASMDTWYSGKALLIGDAVHAVTPHAGQGANITIEDAEALGYLLRDVESSDAIPDVLEKFVSLRKDRVNFVTRRSRELGNIQTDEDRTKVPITSAEFAKEIYTYLGAEHALKVPKPPIGAEATKGAN
ncbi:FAD/NAD(P)-binding domain-containing protein [Hypoxylon trugodes]|uniref:FAD/NAD(P)-binding domain-containing protein n=1 Tax=Hypoxylon trugodes TaxID=326681 RepID=UPI002194D70C|nr:FAD/NAD(P)-binding domain-containing protein [Hypoxylon trugodes]KAI1383409.1 FAD/NAD(P)-binding domain-containing protein [Hypoxylon trugodes]